MQTVYNKMINRLDDYLTEGVIRNYNTNKIPLEINVVLENGIVLKVDEFDDNALLRLSVDINKHKPVVTEPIKYKLNLEIGDTLRVKFDQLENARESFVFSLSEDRYYYGDTVKVKGFNHQDEQVLLSYKDRLSSNQRTFRGNFSNERTFRGNFSNVAKYFERVQSNDHQVPNDTIDDNVDKQLEDFVKEYDEISKPVVGQEYELVDRDGFINSDLQFKDNFTAISSFDRYIVESIHIKEDYPMLGESGVFFENRITNNPYTFVTFDELSKYFKIKDLADNLSGENDEEDEVESFLDFMLKTLDIDANNEYTKTIKEAFEKGNSLVQEFKSITLDDIMGLWEDKIDEVDEVDDEEVTWFIKGVKVDQGSVMRCMGNNSIVNDIKLGKDAKTIIISRTPSWWKEGGAFAEEIDIDRFYVDENDKLRIMDVGNGEWLFV